MSRRYQTILRNALGMLLAFAALNAFAGGYYALSGAPGVPTEWLEGSPFKDYSIPGLILFIVVGGAFLTAATAVFARRPVARFAAFTAVIIVFVWLAVQLAIIGYVSWMQPVTGAVSLVILLLTLVLPEESMAETKRRV